MRDFGLEHEIFVFDDIPAAGASGKGAAWFAPGSMLYRIYRGMVLEIYKLCAYAGHKTLHQADQLGRSVTRLERLIRYRFTLWRLRVSRNFHFALYRFCYPLEQFLNIFAYIRKVRSPVDRAERIPLHTVIWVVCKKSMYPLWRLLVTVLNLAVPALAVWYLVTTVLNYSSTRYGLEVVYNNQVIGNVRDEAQFDEAQRLMNERLQGVAPQTAQVSLRLIPMQGGYADTNDLVDQMIRSSGTELFEGVGLYVDGEFLGALGDSEPLLDDLAARQDKARTGVDGETVAFNRSLSVRSGLYPVRSQTTMEKIDQTLSGQISAEKKYVVQAGDTPSEVAQLNNITTAELERLNPGVLDSFYVGDELLIAHSVPYLRTMLTRPETRNEPIAFPTEQETDDEQLIGYTKVTQEGENGIREVTSLVTYLDDEVISREVIRSEVVKQPTPKKIAVGGRKPERAEPPQTTTTVDRSNDVLPSSGGQFIWPVDGGAVTMPIWGYWGHTGNDITGIPAGTTIRAAASGVVTYSGYTAGGYGQHVIITHPDGTQTLYAHNSANYVRVGDEVVQGQAIAAVGRTGNATGNHCHFEIRYNGQYVDARQYIGSSSPR